jgi:hypothetical protein
MSSPPIHTAVDTGVFSVLGILFRTSQLTTVPARDRFSMTFALEQFLASYAL